MTYQSSPDSLVAKAFEIADECMFERLQSECLRADEFGMVLGLVDESGGEVQLLAEATDVVRAAAEWLVSRGYVEVVEEPGGECLVVLRRPGEDGGASRAC